MIAAASETSHRERVGQGCRCKPGTPEADRRARLRLSVLPPPAPTPAGSPLSGRLPLLLFLDSGKESGLRTKSVVQSALWKVLEESTRRLDCGTEFTGPAGVSAPGLAV